MSYPISPWSDSADCISPDGRYRAIISEAWEVGMGAPTRGTMSIHLLLLYLVTWSLVALTPGPAVMCSMAQATRYGFRSSIAGISGIQLGNLLFFGCIALGLGALLATATTVFLILRIVGAIYLFCLGVLMILSTFRRSSPRAAQRPAPLPAARNLFLQGLLIQITNPKALGVSTGPA